MRNHLPKGFTLIEVIFVISIMAVVYSVALPQFGLITGSDTSERLGQLSVDIRSAFDMAVLNKRPYRLVFMLQSGDYWLEEADRNNIYVGDDKLSRELTAEEEKELEAAFEESFEEYKALSGQEYRDASTDKVMQPFSPVLLAKERLQPVKWRRVDTMEWGRRSIGPNMIFKSFQAEHLAEKQTFDAMGEDARGMLYFFPQGYVEACAMVIAMRKGSREFDTSSEPFTVTCNSYDGTSTVDTGEKELEVVDRERS